MDDMESGGLVLGSASAIDISSSVEDVNIELNETSSTNTEIQYDLTSEEQLLAILIQKFASGSENDEKDFDEIHVRTF